jgi:hypothetical protein
MPKGPSGRIVIDVNPDFKTEIYAALAFKDCTMKEWFQSNAKRLCEAHNQPNLTFVSGPEIAASPTNQSVPKV